MQSKNKGWRVLTGSRQIYQLISKAGDFKYLRKCKFCGNEEPLAR